MGSKEGKSTDPVLDDDNNGLKSAPFRYMGDPSGREAIDIIRDELVAEFGAEGFLAFCRGTYRRYELRNGRKASSLRDFEKITFYRQMFEHASSGAPDPRTSRPGWTPPPGPAQESLPFKVKDNSDD